MRVVVRVDASIEIGSGHVMRCLTLAEMLKENGANVQFICRKHKGNLISNIISKGFNVLVLKASVSSKFDDKLPHSHWLGVTQKQDSKECLSFLKESQVDWLILDHYGIDEEWQEYLGGNYQQLMVIDDLADRKHQCNILLDQTFGRRKKDYKGLVPETCELIVGSQYALLRPEFNNWRQYSLERRKKPVIRELLINMGGIDNKNFTKLVLEEIFRCNLPKEINITIIMGLLSPHLESIKIMAKQLQYKTNVKVQVGNYAEIMANSDIAIGASGITTWERCCLGLPTVQLVTAENQLFLAEVLSNQKIIKLVRKTSELKKLLESAADWVPDISISAKNICTGLGVYKIFNKLINTKINLEEFGEVNLESYVNASKNDKALALKMRNHSKVRRFMFNQQKISEDEHKNFIQKLTERTDIRYFLVKQYKKVIGTINFTEINLHNSIEFGIYANPYEKNKNSGRILELAASHYAFNELGVRKIKLKVLTNNIKAINFYKKSGFELINMTKVNKKNVFCMEKKNN